MIMLADILNTPNFNLLGVFLLSFCEQSYLMRKIFQHIRAVSSEIAYRRFVLKSVSLLLEPSQKVHKVLTRL